MSANFRRFWEVVAESRALQARARELAEQLEQAMAAAMARTDVPEPELTAALTVAACRTVHVASVRRILAGEDDTVVAADHRRRVADALNLVDTTSRYSAK
jgi:hypothetical protein